MQKAGSPYEIANVGLHALNSLRMEKGFRHWGHDIGPADNMLEAGLGFAAKPDASDFIGRDAFVAAKAAGVPELIADKIAEGTWEIEMATERFSAQAQLRAFYDPRGGENAELIALQ